MGGTIKDDIAAMADGELASNSNPDIPPENPPSSPGPLDRLWDLLRRKTGPGDLSAYSDHPANVSKDEDGARVARGLEGLTLGQAGLAVVDLLWGGMKILQRRRAGGGDTKRPTP